MARKNLRPTDGQAETNEPRATENAGNGNGNGRATSDQDLIATEEIAARAYDIYEREGRMDGRDTDHWFRAESELRQERQSRGERFNPEQYANNLDRDFSRRLIAVAQDGLVDRGHIGLRCVERDLGSRILTVHVHFFNTVNLLQRFAEHAHTVVAGHPFNPEHARFPQNCRLLRLINIVRLHDSSSPFHYHRTGEAGGKVIGVGLQYDSSAMSRPGWNRAFPPAPPLRAVQRRRAFAIRRSRACHDKGWNSSRRARR
jgi:hypothetical protein